jgi:hypothetical protein
MQRQPRLTPSTPFLARWLVCSSPHSFAKVKVVLEMVQCRKFPKIFPQLDVNEGIFILMWNSGDD